MVPLSPKERRSLRGRVRSGLGAGHGRVSSGLCGRRSTSGTCDRGPGPGRAAAGAAVLRARRCGAHIINTRPGDPEQTTPLQVQYELPSVRSVAQRFQAAPAASSAEHSTALSPDRKSVV